MTADHLGDVRGFYAALGIELPNQALRDAASRCFAAPDSHTHGDRSPSCSINVASGVWKCHGCGAHGGPYDAALAAGHTPRSAMTLLINHGLAEPRKTNATQWPARRTGSSSGPPGATDRVSSAPVPFAADENDVERSAEMLEANRPLIRRLSRERAWTRPTIQQLGIGYDGARITIPIHNANRRLRGVLRYDAFGRRNPKMLAVRGTRLGLIPHPVDEPSNQVVLVEGPPDMIAARSSGLPAIAVPGTSAWQPTWTRLLADRQITIVMDCDSAGRRAAHEIREAFRASAVEVELIDLAPGRDDGYDLTDRILESRRSSVGSIGLRTNGWLHRGAAARTSTRSHRRASTFG